MPPEDAEGTFELTPETAYMVHISDNTYHVYLNGEFVDIAHSSDIGVKLPIYENTDEIP